MKGHYISYSSAEMAWLKANRRMVISEYHRAFSAAFDRSDVSAAHLHSLRKRKGWKTGRTGQFVKGAAPANKGKTCTPGKGGRHPNARRTHFKKGNLPHNTQYLGHERISKEGYVEISVAETNPHTGYERRYVLKHRYLWEKEHGAIPDGMVLKCKGNRLNTDSSNWVLVPRGVLPRLNGGPHKARLAYDTAPEEIRPTILAVALLDHRVRKSARSNS